MPINEVSNLIQSESSVSVNQIIKEVGKQSLKAGKYFVLISIVYGVLNLFFLTITLILFFRSESSCFNIVCLIFVIFIGIGITIMAYSLTYRYILIDTLSIIYKYLTPFFKRLSMVIIDKITSKTIDYSFGEKFQKSLNIGNLLLDIYGNKVPKLLQKAISYLLKKIPFSHFIFNMKSEFGDKDSNNLSEILYQQIDQYIKQSILLTNNMRWIRWLLPINIILQMLLIYLIE